MYKLFPNGSSLSITHADLGKFYSIGTSDNSQINMNVLYDSVNNVRYSLNIMVSANHLDYLTFESHNKKNDLQSIVFSLSNPSTNNNQVSISYFYNGTAHLCEANDDRISSYILALLEQVKIFNTHYTDISSFDKNHHQIIDDSFKVIRAKEFSHSFHAGMKKIVNWPSKLDLGSLGEITKSIEHENEVLKKYLETKVNEYSESRKASNIQMKNI
ncbi:MAG: hypothetical protein SFW66_03230 [Gammaproteobacteria bacterium]|nr:hypothetical protein [Gammaproteobacteria bacterium]